MPAEVLDEEELSEEDELAINRRSKKPVFGYYQQPDGTICVNVTSPAERMSFMEEGWRYLPQYGAFDLTTEYASNHPFECFLMYGGAEIMPKEQVIEQGWNIHPPMIPRCKQPIAPGHKKHNVRCLPPVKVKFPQIVEGVDDIPYPCRDETCSRSFPENAFPTELGRNQHESVMHKDEKKDIRTGETLGNSIVEGLTKAFANMGMPQLTPEQIKVLKEAGLYNG